MIVTSYYNKEEQILSITTSESSNSDQYSKEGNKIIFTNQNDEVTAMTVLNVNISANSGLIDNNQILDIINENMKLENVEFPFVVGQIEKIEKHPKSEKLNICQVNLGTTTTQIVCGASNVKEGIKVIVAKCGAVMPTGMKIVPSKLINVDSNGMICSLYELGKSLETGKGIAILDENIEIGTKFN